MDSVSPTPRNSSSSQDTNHKGQTQREEEVKSIYAQLPLQLIESCGSFDCMQLIRTVLVSLQTEGVGGKPTTPVRTSSMDQTNAIKSVLQAVCHAKKCPLVVLTTTTTTTTRNSPKTWQNAHSVDEEEEDELEQILERGGTIVVAMQNQTQRRMALQVLQIFCRGDDEKKSPGKFILIEDL
jgi:hypothetical protein